MNRDSIFSAIEGCPFFQNLDRAHVEAVADLCTTATYAPGQFVFNQGETGEKLYIVAEGRVYLERALDLGERQGRAVIDTLCRGRLFGCWGTLLGESHRLLSSASCQTQTITVEFKGADLRALMMREMPFGIIMLERVCFLLRDRIQHAYGALERM